jgi:LEA14-like dessication related protein
MKKRTGLLLTLFTLIPILGISCSSLPGLLKQKPTASVKSARLHALNLEYIELKVDVEIKNPYPVGIKLNDLTTNVAVEKKHVLQTGTKDVLEIKASSAHTSTFLVKLHYNKIGSVVSDYMNRDYLHCDITGDITLALPNIPGLPPTLKIPYSTQKRIPVVRPTVRISNFKFNIMRGEMSYDITIKNSAKTPIQFQTINYSLVMNGNPVVRSTNANPQNGPNGSTIHVENKLGGLIAALGNAIASGNLRYSFVGKSTLQFGDETVDYEISQEGAVEK